MPNSTMTDPRDAIARSKRILRLVDEYHENPTRDTRAALRVALMDEFQPEPRAEVADVQLYAERYRWVRQVKARDEVMNEFVIGSPEELDAAIDAGRSGGQS